MMEKNRVDKVLRWLVLLRWVSKVVVDEGYLIHLCQERGYENAMFYWNNPILFAHFLPAAPGQVEGRGAVCTVAFELALAPRTRASVISAQLPSPKLHSPHPPEFELSVQKWYSLVQNKTGVYDECAT